MSRIIPDLVLSVLALFALVSSSGCYTQLAVSEVDDTSVPEIIILYPLFPPIPPPPVPCCPDAQIEYPTSMPPAKDDSDRRDFGSHRLDGRDQGDDRRKGGSGGRDR